MPTLLAYSLLFTGIAVFFIFIHLLLGKFVRPNKPDAEKKTIYECGEPTIGSSWIQFDLRFYVVALLFVIFDVEMAFFFPWAVVFGKTNALSKTSIEAEARIETAKSLQPPANWALAGEKIAEGKEPIEWQRFVEYSRQQELPLRTEGDRASGTPPAYKSEFMDESSKNPLRLKDNAGQPTPVEKVRDRAEKLALFAFIDILVFFGVLLVGFAYLWRRGDLNWVRSTAAQQPPADADAPLEAELVEA